LTQLGSRYSHCKRKYASENSFIHPADTPAVFPATHTIPRQPSPLLLEPLPRRRPLKAARTNHSCGEDPEYLQAVLVRRLPHAQLGHERRRVLAALVHLGERDPGVVVVAVPKADRREPVCGGVAMEPGESVRVVVYGCQQARAEAMVASITA
jgi:hypothetical protein